MESAAVTGQVDAVRFRTTQLLEAIQALLAVVDRPDAPMATPTWPDVLAKYNVILSLSSSLARGIPDLLHRLALHPAHSLSEVALDSDLSAVLRTQQTFSVLEAESAAVTHVQQALATSASTSLATVRAEHDARVERASKAVQMLREKFDWKARVEITQDDDQPHHADQPVPAYALELGPGDVGFDGIINPTDPDPDPDTDMELDGPAEGDTDDEVEEDEVEGLDAVLDSNDPIFTPDPAMPDA